MKLNEIKPITEARDATLQYTEKRVKGEIERVTVALEANQSGKFTRIARDYRKLQNGIEVLNEKMKALNSHIKDNAIELFNAEDEVYTRVVETLSLTMTISKKTTVTSTTVNYDKVIAQLGEMVPELNEKIKELIAANTEIKVSEKSPSLRTALKESIWDDAVSKIKKLSKNVLSAVLSWGKTYDKKLAKLKILVG